VVFDDQRHLELALPLLASEPAGPLEPFDVPVLLGHGGDIVEVEDIAVQQQLDWPGGHFLDVIEERRKVVVDEELPTLVGHPHRAVRVGLMRLREVHVGDDVRMEVGFHRAGSLVCQAVRRDSSNPHFG
jgi:hypothetical protein